jgi:preprotein translocase subunit SecD
LALSSILRVRSAWLILAATCLCAGCEPSANPRKLAASASLDVFAVSATEVPDSRATIDPETGATIYLVVPAVLESADVQSVERSDNSQDLPTLIFTLTPDGGKKLAVATTPATGQQLAVVVNGKVMSVVSVRSPLGGDKFEISGGQFQKNSEAVFKALTTD